MAKEPVDPQQQWIHKIKSKAKWEGNSNICPKDVESAFLNAGTKSNMIIYATQPDGTYCSKYHVSQSNLHCQLTGKNQHHAKLRMVK